MTVQMERGEVAVLFRIALRFEGFMKDGKKHGPAKVRYGDGAAFEGNYT